MAWGAQGVAVHVVELMCFTLHTCGALKLSEPFDITHKDASSYHGVEQRCVAFDGSCDSVFQCIT